MSEFKVERAAFKAVLRAVNKRVSDGAKTSFHRWALAVMAQIKLSIAARFKNRGGRFRGSFSVRMTGKGSDREARFASTHKGARLQEYGSAGLPGGVVRPKRAKFLAIPVEGSPAMTRGGVLRCGSPLRTTLPKNYSFWFMGDDSGGALMGRRKGARDGKAQAWYWLRKSVRIPPRLRMRESVRRAIGVLKAELAQKVNRG